MKVYMLDGAVRFNYVLILLCVCLLEVSIAYSNGYNDYYGKHPKHKGKKVKNVKTHGVEQEGKAYNLNDAVQQWGGAPNSQLDEEDDQMLNSYLLSINGPLHKQPVTWNERVIVKFTPKMWYTVPPWDIKFEKVYLGPLKRDGPSWVNPDGTAFAILTTVEPALAFYSRASSNTGDGNPKSQFWMMVSGVKLLLRYHLGDLENKPPLKCKQHGPSALTVLGIDKFKYSFDDMPMFPNYLQSATDQTYIPTVYTPQAEMEQDGATKLIELFFERSQIRELLVQRLVCLGPNDLHLEQSWPPPVVKEGDYRGDDEEEDDESATEDPEEADGKDPEEDEEDHYRGRMFRMKQIDEPLSDPVISDSLEPYTGGLHKDNKQRKKKEFSGPYYNYHYSHDYEKYIPKASESKDHKPKTSDAQTGYEKYIPKEYMPKGFSQDTKHYSPNKYYNSRQKDIFSQYQNYVTKHYNNGYEEYIPEQYSKGYEEYIPEQYNKGYQEYTPKESDIGYEQYIPEQYNKGYQEYTPEESDIGYEQYIPDQYNKGYQEYTPKEADIGYEQYLPDQYNKGYQEYTPEESDIGYEQYIPNWS